MLALVELFRNCDFFLLFQNVFNAVTFLEYLPCEVVGCCMNLTEMLQKYRTRIDGVLTRHIDNLPEVSDELRQAMRHGLLLGGKRVRPFLVYSVGSMLGADDEVMDAPAAAIECIHAYSLIHDDLPCMDNDDLRRGQPTVHKLYGEAQGMLAGDALQTLGFEILSHHVMPPQMQSNQLAMMRILSHSTGYCGMCGGQSLDLLGENARLNQQELEKVHRHKTGALIEAAVLMGALCVPTIDPQYYELLKRYADAIGLAFQVHDDILDVIGDTTTLGKPQGSDIENAKSTYPSLMGLEAAQHYERQLIDEAFSALKPLQFDTSVLEQFAKFIIERNS